MEWFGVDFMSYDRSILFRMCILSNSYKKFYITPNISPQKRIFQVCFRYAPNNFNLYFSNVHNSFSSDTNPVIAIASKVNDKSFYSYCFVNK